MSIVAVNAKYAEVLGHDIEKFSEYLLYISFLDFSSLRCLSVSWLVTIPVLTV
jgi:hypothetical protein